MEGNTSELDGIEGWRVMEIIRDSGLPIRADCGGALLLCNVSCLCGT